MGFFSPSLGFTSTAGAFIGGFAKQANENIEQSNAIESAADRAWAIKADKAISDSNKEQKQISDDKNVYNTMLDTLGGNKKAADLLYTRWKSTGGKKDWGELIDPSTVSPGDPNYKSNVLGDLNNRQAQGQTNTQSIYDKVKPQYKKYMQPPRSPFDSPAGGMLAPPTTLNGPRGTAGGGDTDGSLPTDASAAPINPAAPPSPLDPGQTPTGTTPTGTPTIPRNPAGTTGMSLDTPDMDVGPEGAGGGDTSGSLPGDRPMQMAQAAPNGSSSSINGILFGPKSNKNTALTPYQEQMIKHQKNQEDLARQRFEEEKSRKPATPQQQQDLQIGTDWGKHYYFDKTQGLESRLKDLKALQTQKFENQSIMGMLNNGLSAKATQPALDELNRWTTATLGLDLKRDLGFDANRYSDVNLLKKDIANSVIDRLSTLHFGRITNKEMEMVNKGFASTGNDPNTNLKITLTMRHVLDTAMNGTRDEMNAAYKDMGTDKFSFMKGAQAGTAAKMKALNALSDEETPWTQLNLSTMSPEKAREAINKIGKGVWMEDTSAGPDNGIMFMIDPYTGKLRQAGDTTNAR